MLKAEFRVATKELVDSLLAANTGNRPIRKSVVDRYSREIKAGTWVATNQGVGVSELGVLLDGQHRLMALAACGYPPLLILVVTGLPEDARFAIDQHSKRSARDMLAFAYDARVVRLAPAIANILLYERNGWNYRTTMKEVHDCILDHQVQIEFCLGVPRKYVFFAAVDYAAFVTCLRDGIISEERLMEFMRAVEDGEMLPATSPAFLLRNLILKGKGVMSGQSLRRERFAKTCKAVEAYAKNKPLSSLYIRTSA